jgi:hypothetical protein
MGIGVRPTFTTKYFHKWKGAYTPYKYIRLGLQKTNVVFHYTFYKDL